jgi:hypothetical protein
MNVLTNTFANTNTLTSLSIDVLSRRQRHGGLGSLTSLLRLELANLNVESDAVEGVRRIIAFNRLTKLSLCGVRVDCTELFSTIKTNTSLRELGLPCACDLCFVRIDSSFAAYRVADGEQCCVVGQCDRSSRIDHTPEHQRPRICQR